MEDRGTDGLLYPISHLLTPAPTWSGLWPIGSGQVGDFTLLRGGAPLEGTASKGRPEFSVRYGLANP